MQYVGEKELEEMILNVYYDDQVSHSVLYEDAGDNYGYRNEQYNVTRFKLTGDKHQVRLKEKYFGQFDASYRKHRVIFHGIPFQATEYVVDGKPHKLSARNFAVGTVKVVVDRAFEELIIR